MSEHVLVRTPGKEPRVVTMPSAPLTPTAHLVDYEHDSWWHWEGSGEEVIDV